MANPANTQTCYNPSATKELQRRRLSARMSPFLMFASVLEGAGFKESQQVASRVSNFSSYLAEA